MATFDNSLSQLGLVQNRLVFSILALNDIKKGNTVTFFGNPTPTRLEKYKKEHSFVVTKSDAIPTHLNVNKLNSPPNQKCLALIEYNIKLEIFDSLFLQKSLLVNDIISFYNCNATRITVLKQIISSIYLLTIIFYH